MTSALAVVCSVFATLVFFVYLMGECFGLIFSWHCHNFFSLQMEMCGYRISLHYTPANTNRLPQLTLKTPFFWISTKVKWHIAYGLLNLISKQWLENLLPVQWWTNVKLKFTVARSQNLGGSYGSNSIFINSVEVGGTLGRSKLWIATKYGHFQNIWFHVTVLCRCGRVYSIRTLSDCYQRLIWIEPVWQWSTSTQKQIMITKKNSTCLILQKVTEPFLNHCDACKPQWVPLSMKWESTVQWWTFHRVAVILMIPRTQWR